MARYDFIAVYLMASKPQRGFEHREGRFDGFAKKYGCRTLVWWEQHFDINDAIAREKQIKGWRRKWKLALIEKENPVWRDLYEDFLLPRHLRQSADDPEACLPWVPDRASRVRND